MTLFMGKEITNIMSNPRIRHPNTCGRYSCGQRCKNQGFIPFRLPQRIVDVQQKKQQEQPPKSTTNAPTKKSKRSCFGFKPKSQQQQETSLAATASSSSSKNDLPKKNRKRDSVRHAACKAKKAIYKSCGRYTEWRTMDLFAGEGKACI